MTVTVTELATALQKKLDVDGLIPEDILQNNLAYIGSTNASRLTNIGEYVVFRTFRGEELEELVRDITSRTGCRIDIDEHMDMGGYIRWTALAYYPTHQVTAQVVVDTPILLDRYSAALLLDLRKPATSNGVWYNSKFKSVALEWRGPFISKLVLTSEAGFENNNLEFRTTLDKLYKAVVVDKLPDAKLYTLDCKGDLRKQDLFLDYRRCNIADTVYDAQVSRMKVQNESVAYSLQRNIDILIPYLDRGDLKPWLDMKWEKPLISSASLIHFKNLYYRQGKYDVKIQTMIGQRLVTTCYDQFIAAVYADAFIHTHWAEVSGARDRLNFPQSRIPLKCICKDCADIVRKRGPQPKIDTLLYCEEYVNENKN